MDAKIASIPCDSKRNLLDVPAARIACSVPGMETIGQRVKRLRTAKGWSRPELGRLMSKAIDRSEPFSGELVRLYEMDKNRPGKDATKALAAVFSKTEQYIVYGDAIQVAHLPSANESAAPYSVDSPDTVRLIKAFTWLTDAQKGETLRDLESKAAANKAIAKELGIRFEFKTDQEVEAHLRPVPRHANKKQRR